MQVCTQTHLESLSGIATVSLTKSKLLIILGGKVTQSREQVTMVTYSVK